MSTTALAQFLEIKNAGTRLAAYQNYWPGQTVNGYAHFPFRSAGIIADSNGGQSTFTLTFPATYEAIQLLENGLSNGHVVRVQTYQFSPPADNSFPVSRTLVAQFDGEIITGTAGQTEVTVTLGSSLDPVGAQVPPRKFTSTLVGELPRY